MKVSFQTGLVKWISLILIGLGAFEAISFAGVKEDLLEAVQVMTLQKLSCLEQGIHTLKETDFEDPSSFWEAASTQFDQMKQEVMSEVLKEIEKAQLIEKYSTKICSYDSSGKTLAASLDPCFIEKSSALISLSAFIDQQFVLHHWESEHVFQTLKDSLNESSLR